jgi:hypothetical protein
MTLRGLIVALDGCGLTVTDWELLQEEAGKMGFTDAATVEEPEPPNPNACKCICIGCGNEHEIAEDDDEGEE